MEQIRAEAPGRIDTVKNIDPNAVQEKATARAKEAQETLQAKVTEFLGTLDTDLKKLGESAQDFALRGVGVAAEYAVKARETYEKVAEHGEQTVRTWRGEAAEEIEDFAIAVEPKAEPVEVKEEVKPHGRRRGRRLQEEPGEEGPGAQAGRQEDGSAREVGERGDTTSPDADGPGTLRVPGPFSGYGGRRDDSNRRWALC